MLGVICGVIATCIGGAVVVMVASAVERDTMVYLLRVGGSALLGLCLFACGAWAVQHARAWARGEKR
jgi:hypothetical protein